MINNRRVPLWQFTIQDDHSRFLYTRFVACLKPNPGLPMRLQPYVSHETVEVKVFLLRNRLSIAQMARELMTPTQTEEALRVMLSQMIHGRRFYPALAKRALDRYGIKFRRQASPRRRAA